MKIGEVEQQADDVLSAYEVCTAPVDVLTIAKAEGIELAEGDYAEPFCGRIEYHREVGSFVLFHPRLETARSLGRARFSIAHELGHYFLEHHRAMLMSGGSHNSTSDFICDDALEREADGFAAALLIPSFALRQRLARRRFMTLREVLALAQEWQSSATSAAIRYARFTSEACSVVVSQDGIVQFYSPSDEARAMGFGFLRKGAPVPSRSKTFDAGKPDVANDIREGTSNTEDWFSERRFHRELWEEAFPLGGTGMVLTLLALKTGPD
ncbi:MAG: ImmA/IrrE family metallo-endopeptidase [Verrucomicrobia bacterium]|nr:ImmA/IrrE family metallo-endopeptidase [Verrucomicrobiota bacterium]